jgi:hydroxymethylpyrimidine/phosphomethylpyrimidine kinase
MTPIAVTIAGSDSSGGAGIQADLKTFSALGAYGASVITALTAQNTLGVQAIHDVPPAFIRSQMETVLDDLVLAVRDAKASVCDALEELRRKAARRLYELADRLLATERR